MLKEYNQIICDEKEDECSFLKYNEKFRLANIQFLNKYRLTKYEHFLFIKN